MNNITEGYRFLTEGVEEGVVNIELTSGEYEGIIYRYGKVGVNEDKENDRVYLNFIFEVVDTNGFENLIENVEFKNYIGQILSNIISQNLSQPENDSTIDEVIE